MLQRIRKAQENESGFTLIELLIVVLVLGILAAIVLFALGTFKSDSQVAACKTDAKSVATAEAAFFAKNGSYTTDLGTLVSQSYLRTNPNDTSNGYSLSVASSTGVVTATAANGSNADFSTCTG